MAAPVEQHVDGVWKAVITRADGTVEDLGVIAADYSNPVRRAMWRAFGARLATYRTKRANRNAACKAQEGR